MRRLAAIVVIASLASQLTGCLPTRAQNELYEGLAFNTNYLDHGLREAWASDARTLEQVDALQLPALAHVTFTAPTVRFEGINLLSFEGTDETANAGALLRGYFYHGGGWLTEESAGYICLSLVLTADTTTYEQIECELSVLAFDTHLFVEVPFDEKIRPLLDTTG